jgi:Fe-S oxidoreductase
MDEDGSVCCGRPLMMSGNDSAAQELIKKNIQIIKSSQAKLLVTSCPICFKIFTEEYKLDIEVMHHTQYLLKLAEEKKINLRKNNKTVVFHDPCELGRGSKIYEQPRKVLEMISTVKSLKNEKNVSLCCGGSLGNTELDYYKRDEITKNALMELENEKPDMLVTACPLCKKTFNKFSKSEIMDIVELVDESTENQPAMKKVQ